MYATLSSLSLVLDILFFDCSGRSDKANFLGHFLIKSLHFVDFLFQSSASANFVL